MTLAEFTEGLTTFQESQFHKLIQKLRSRGIAKPQPNDPDVKLFAEGLTIFQQSHFYKIAESLLAN